MTIVFIHGLDSSSRGSKALWFKEHFPVMLVPDFTGSLEERMDTLIHKVAGSENLVLVGSSFGGLMAANEVISHCELLIASGDVAAIDGNRYAATGKSNFKMYIESLRPDY